MRNEKQEQNNAKQNIKRIQKKKKETQFKIKIKRKSQIKTRTV